MNEFSKVETKKLLSGKISYRPITSVIYASKQVRRKFQNPSIKFLTLQITMAQVNVMVKSFTLKKQLGMKTKFNPT